ncbi:Alkaline protease secretion ATP-binding protein AprD [Sterolibacterium denitrificans]|uniref:Alkaline protease secretion ATP-binding protein AprD n=1 Tax=Sterolibacterium denitrificans TaxID=157592 RepID=A0A7Z7HSE0_9PROT|nr:type I secretion system permease/ATPase [Sterolibacterium denitrificans]SMB27243.1 Alkaline protease secretion ATP-binding protein AprD [Sterolibacterium denitrificans]
MKKLLDSQLEIDEALLGFRQTLLRVGGFSFVVNLLMLTPAIYMLQIYDRVLVSRNGMTLLVLTLLVVGLFMLVGGLEWVRSRLLVRMGTALDTRLSARVFTAAFQRNLQRAGGTPAQALNDLTTLRQFLAGPGVFAFFDLPWTPIYLLACALLHPWIGLFALCATLVLAALAWMNEMATRKPLLEANAHALIATQFANNNLRNAEMIAALGMTDQVRARWAEQQQKVLALQTLASERGGTIAASSRFIRMTAQSLILGVGAWLALDNTVSSGAVIAGSILMGRALSPVDQTIAVWKNWLATRTAYFRLAELLARYPAERERLPLPAPSGHVTVENVVLVPPGGDVPVLKGLAFQIPRGSVVGVIGPSGAGKTTLAKALIGVWRPRQGHVRLDGADVADWDKRDLGRALGYLPQGAELLEGTVAENIARFGGLTSEPIVAAAKLAGVHELILRLPKGYDTPVGVDGGQLSAGQRQRVALARALYGDPALLVLDEPNSNLDEAGEQALADAIRAVQARGGTVVVISHRASALAVMDRILLMRDGMLAAYGPRDDVIAAMQQGAVPGIRSLPAEIGKENEADTAQQADDEAAEGEGREA